MATQISLERCGVVLLNRSQGGTVPGPKPRRAPNNATDCGSDSPVVTRAGAEQSKNATGYQQPLRIAHWNAEGVQRKKLEL